jgi:hypothetical protein
MTINFRLPAHFDDADRRHAHACFDVADGLGDHRLKDPLWPSDDEPDARQKPDASTTR